ncbi:hypothetical protein DFJ73DRAFT_764065 [Zopfochytrium polystomum]|nr:hypothetical protein DFJ73DRAFT_764058 [Zopfochytrium polystomum]KAI9334661.1 hypothetical protein DFJ73DRAFT_764065 [Zopfochytrium polystomum]
MVLSKSILVLALLLLSATTAIGEDPLLTSCLCFKEIHLSNRPSRPSPLLSSRQYWKLVKAASPRRQFCKLVEAACRQFCKLVEAASNVWLGLKRYRFRCL